MAAPRDRGVFICGNELHAGADRTSFVDLGKHPSLHAMQRIDLHDFDGGLRDLQMRVALEWPCRCFMGFCLYDLPRFFGPIVT